ncbi:hypothetical protein D3C85_1052460 [compost metagenome]
MIVQYAERSLPGGALLGRAAQGCAEEGEVLGIGLAVEVGGEVRDELPLEVGLPVIDRGLLHHLVQGRKVARLADDQALLPRKAGLAEIGVPVDGGGEALELAHRPLVVILLPVPQGHVVPLDLGEPGLESQDAFGLGPRIRLAEAAQHGGDVLLVFLQQRLAGGIRLEIVIPVRQAEPGLIEVDRIAVRCLGVRVYPEAERGVATDAAALGECAGEVLRGSDLLYLAQHGQQRRSALGVAGILIQIALVKIPDLLGLGAGGGLAVQPFHQHPHVRQGLVPQHVEGAVGGPVVRDLGGTEPVAVHVAEEVVTGFDPGVHVGQREAGVLVCLVRSLTAAGQQGQPDEAGQYAFLIVHFSDSNSGYSASLPRSGGNSL